MEKSAKIAQVALRAWSGSSGFKKEYMASDRGKHITRAVHNLLVEYGMVIDTVWWWRD
jgi:hypothetical protein